MAARIVEFSEYDVVVPFVCHRCGNCCRNFYPAIDVGILVESSLALNIPIETIQAELDRRCEAHNAGTPMDCFFLAPGGDGCTIHPFRPDCCAMFPSLTDSGAGRVDCPGHREFQRMVEALARREEGARIRATSSLIRPRPVPGGTWDEMLLALQRERISDGWLRALSSMNGR